MRKPKAVYCKNKGVVHHYELPDKEWLEHHYVTLNKSTVEMSREFGVSRHTLCNWCRKLGVPVRTSEEVGERNSRQFLGRGNSAWKGGSARNYQKRLLQKHQPEMICEWCGNAEDVEMHHCNHDTTDGNVDNLVWMCRECHRAETGLWQVRRNSAALNKIMELAGGWLKEEFR